MVVNFKEKKHLKFGIILKYAFYVIHGTGT